MIERLYLNFISDIDAYTELSETREARDAIDVFMEKDNQCKEQLADLICGYGDGKEKQGFLNGFKCAFLLASETLGNI